MKTILSIAFITCMFLSATAQTKNEGRTKMVKNITSRSRETGGKSAEWQWATDELSFPTGMLRSKMMHEHEKFEDATCTINIDSSSAGKTMTFKAEKDNAKGAKVKWNGKATGNHIEGTAVWTNEKGNKQTYSFTGTLAK